MTSAASTQDRAHLAAAIRDPRWLGLLLILVPLLTRATTAMTVMPEWDVDPLASSISAPAIGPAGSMLIDALVLIGAALVLLAEVRARRVVHPLWLLGLGLGAAAVILHGWFWPATGSWSPRGTLGNQRLGAAWLSALAAGIAVAHVARDAAVRRLITGVLLALILLLAIRGGQQVLIEHPAAVAAFKANRDAELAARGWTPGSAMAQAYERRLMQTEATGWFGLSNVYASFAALGAAISLAWIVARRRPPADTEPHRGGLGLPALCLLLSLAAATLAFSKGGIVVTLLALGFCLALIPRLAASLTRLRSLIGPACIFGVLLAVAIRGVIGERIGELSILFRWFYMQASGRIIAANPLTGVGPDGYQLAYLTAKNPLNPEEVTSPHSVLLDWVSTLGAWGLAWAAVLIALSVFVGRALLSRDDSPAPTPPSTPTSTTVVSRIGMLALALSCIAAMASETPYITPDLALVRLGALAVGCLVIHALAAASPRTDRTLTIGLAAGSLAMLAHAQIELTATNAAACGLFMLALAAAAGASLPAPAAASTASIDAAPARFRAITITAALALALTAGWFVIHGVLPARAWQHELKLAAAQVRPIAEISERASSLSPTSSLEDRASIINDLGQLLGRTVPATPTGFAAAMAELDRRLIPPAADTLTRALARYPDEWRIAREAARLHLRLAAVSASNPATAALTQQDHAAALKAMRLPPAPADTARGLHPPRLRAQALVYETIARQRADSASLAPAFDLLTTAFAADPYNLEVAHRLFRLARELNRPDQARFWAGKTLELAALDRLNPGIQSLSDAERRELEAAAAPAAP